MNDKELILEAIDNYDLLTKSQNTILSELVHMAIGNVATITPLSLSVITKKRVNIIYRILKQLKFQGFIISLKEPESKIGVIKLNYAKLKIIKEIYLKRKKREKVEKKS